MTVDYDYVLIDSRTGVSDTSGILTVQMPDRIVACFSYNHQSVEGAASVLQSVMRQREHLPPRIFPVATRVEFAEKERLDRARTVAMMRMSPFLQSTPGDQFHKYWAEVETSYSPVYAYAEVLAPFVDRPEDPRSILSSAIRLTSYLTDGEVAGMSSMPEAVRRAVRERFE
jgi:MinD-like ATPase involved in chromosome partitioning or flagellar assembly